MTNPDPAASAALRAADATLRRTSAAYGLDRARLTLALHPSPPGWEIVLTFNPQDGRDPFRQRRYLQGNRDSRRELVAEARSEVEEMAWNVALAFRPERPVAPTAWSIHPAAASIVAAAGTALPNPADPCAWLEQGDRKIHLPDGGHVADAVFSSREGVLLLDRARLVDGRGDTLATVKTTGPRLHVTLPGAYPETYATALPRRLARTLCDVFDADPRCRDLPIHSARNQPGPIPRLVVQLADRLVPLLASTPGGESWRPRTARAVVGDRTGAFDPWLLAHSAGTMMRYYSRASGIVPPPPLGSAPSRLPPSMAAKPSSGPATGTARHCVHGTAQQGPTRGGVRPSPAAGQA